MASMTDKRGTHLLPTSLSVDTGSTSSKTHKLPGQHIALFCAATFSITLQLLGQNVNTSHNRHSHTSDH
jgi:hypothetical protein